MLPFVYFLDFLLLINAQCFFSFPSLISIPLTFCGFSEEKGDLTGVVDLVDDDPEQEFRTELFRCVSKFSQQLGKTASSIFYESLLSSPAISSEDIVHCIVKILETGYGSLDPVFHRYIPGNDLVREKELSDHRDLRKLSIDMFVSLQGLYKKAASWGRILNVIQDFLKFLVPHKIVHNLNSAKSSNINSSVVVHAAYQIAKVMYESAWDLLLFLSYLLDISGQVSVNMFLLLLLLFYCLRNLLFLYLRLCFLSVFVANNSWYQMVLVKFV